MTSRRELLVSLGLLVVGGLLVLVAAGRPWVSHRVGLAAPLPTRTVSENGAHVAGRLRPLALLGLAACAAVPATRGLARVLVGIVAAVAGVGVLLAVLRFLADPATSLTGVPRSSAHDVSGWPYVALLGALLIATGGVLVVVRGRSWVSMSSRYDAPSQRPRAGEGSLWDALDRGEDPTGEAADTGG